MMANLRRSILLAALLVLCCYLCNASSAAAAGGPHCYVVGADLGTESCRVALFDICSDEHCSIPLVSHAVPYKTSYPAPGYAEQNPADWWSALGQACRSCCSGIDPTLIKGICIDTTACSVVALDHTFKPLRPCLLWCDVRSSNQCIEILAKGKGDPALRVNSNGCGPISAEWMIPKALWIKQNEPEIWARARYICEKQDYINYMLTGELTASSCNVAARWHWDANEALNSPPSSINGRPMSLLRRIGLEDLASKWPIRTVAMGDRVGVLSLSAAEHLLGPGVGLGAPPADIIIPVIQGGPDAYVGMVGLGAVSAGRLSVITGSSHLHLVVTAGDAASDGIWGPYRGAPLAGPLAFAEGGQSSTGSALTWMKRMLNASFADLDAEAAAVPPGSEGVLAFEKFQGSRTPRTDPLARGAFAGLTLAHSRGHLWRSLLEAICLGTRAAIEGLARAGHPATEILISGGATRSEVFLQLHADVTGLPIVCGVYDNAPLLGCAVLAAAATDYFAPSSSSSSAGSDGHSRYGAIADRVSRAIECMVRTSRVIQPSAATKSLYDRLFYLYKGLESSIEGLSHQLASPLPPGSSSSSSRSGRSSSGRELVVSPSMLSANFGKLGEEARQLAAAGATIVHIDMCDSCDKCLGSLTFGPAAIAAIHNAAPTLFLDVHAVCRPATTLALLAKLSSAGVSRLILQFELFEGTSDFVQVATTARDLGMAVGVCIEPRTSAESLQEVLSAKYRPSHQGGSGAHNTIDTPLIEMVDVLAVDCGIAGQIFDHEVLEKVVYLCDRYSGSLRHIAVDGGITDVTAALAAKAGANLLVAGSFIFKDVYANYHSLVAVLDQHAV